METYPVDDIFLEWSSKSRSQLLRFFGFNTLVSIVAYAGSNDDQAERARLEKALMDAFEACVRYEGLFSRTLPSSDISLINGAGGKRVAVHEDTYGMLEAAKTFCKHSLGAFDITIGSATTLWDFHRGIAPDPDALAEAMRHVDWENLVLSSEDGRYYAQLLDPLAKLDAGGIAKGWIADRLVEQLCDAGIHAALIDIGGNVVVLGNKPDGSPWRIAIRDPRHPLFEGKYLDIVELQRGSIATSGIYERRFEDAQGPHHHILDAKTGLSLDCKWESASVVAKDATYAEGFSTTMLSLDEASAKEMTKEHPEIELVIFVAKDGSVVMVDGQR